MAGPSTKRSAIEITGEFVREVRSFDNDDGRVIIGEIRVPTLHAALTGETNGDLTILTRIKGPDDGHDLTPNLSYRFLGRWNDYRGTRQFWFTQFTQLAPTTKSAVTQYLVRYCHGIGYSLAGKLFDAYGPATCRVLREDPALAANEITGLTIETAKLAQEALLANEQLEATRVELNELLAGRGFSKSMIDVLLKHSGYGIDAAKIIRRNPYSLLVNSIKSAGFTRVDRLYLDLKHSPHKLKRQMFCALDAIKKSGDGHTWYSAQQLGEQIKRKVGGTNAKPVKALKLGIRGGYFARHRDDVGQVWIAESLAADNEAVIAERITELNSHGEPSWPDASTLEQLSDHQREVLARSLSAHVGLLLGTPGTGKTFTAAAIMQRLCEDVGAHRIACAAPTGKAAVRLTSSLQSYGLPLKATTIHSLMYQAMDYGSLPYDYFVLDESSMIDTDLAAELLRLIPRGSHVLIIGDPYQLPPVGHGAVLRDLIAANVPQGELSEIKRNAGRIVQACREIRESGTYQPSPKFDAEAGENLVHIEAASPELAVARLTQLLQRTPEGINPTWDCQVIVAVNEKTPISRKELNLNLQGLLNPGGEPIGDTGFRLNDKVICNLNSTFPLTTGRCEYCETTTHDPTCPDCGTKQGNREERVAKGEIGRITHVLAKHLVITLESPVRSVRIPVRADNDGESGALGLWDLGYAITGHKSQGSQWKYVFVMADDSRGADMVTCREWHYTAISRAELGCFTIGRKTAIDRQCRRVSLKDRKTFLVEKLREMGARQMDAGQGDEEVREEVGA